MAPDLQNENEQLNQRLRELEADVESLRQEIAQFDEYFGSSTIGFCLLDTDFRYLRINQVLADLNGFSIEEHVGSHLSERIPRLYEFVVPTIRRVIETGEAIIGLEITGVSSSSPMVESTVLADYFPVLDKSGNVSAVGIVVHDVTSFKGEIINRAEKEFLDNEIRYRDLLNHSPEAIVVFDADIGKFVDGNKTAELFFGLDREALLKTGPAEMSPELQPDGQSSFGAAAHFIDQAFAGKSPIFEWRHRNAAGDEIPCEVRVVHLPKSGRRLVRASITDISERKKEELLLEQAHNKLEMRVQERTAKLSQSEERWRSLVETAPDLIMTINPSGNIEYINRVEPGFDINEVIGSPARDYIQPSFRGQFDECLKLVIETGSQENMESAVDMPDGSVFWYSSRMGPLHEEGKIIGVTLITTDITERKQTEERLKADERLLRKLLEVQEAERRMVAYDIHDGFIQYAVGAHMMMESVLSEIDEQQLKPTLQQVHSLLVKTIAEGRRLIRDLRPMVLDEYGVLDAVQHLIADEKERGLIVAFQHEVQFERLDRRLEGVVFRVVQEALNNVRRHGQTDHAAVHLTQENGKLRVMVRDHGVGFDPKKVSAQYFGLRGIHERARLFDGTAQIDSSVGEGTTVTVELPIS